VTRSASSSRVGKNALAALAAGVAAVVIAAVGIPVSAASWVDREWATASVSALDCDDAAVVNSTAWGRVLTGSLSGQSLAPVAAIDGVTVSNLAPATSSSASSSSATTSLGSDAWTTALNLTTLPGLSVGAGVTLPFGTNTGAYTQYGRATGSGLSVGASGAVTSAGSGVVALETPGAATPRLATLQLSTLLNSSLAGLGVTTGRLADAKLRIGTVGAIASYASCDPLWNGSAPGAALVREYLVNDLGLEVTSSLVTDLSTSITGSLTTLEATLDALGGAKAVPAALQSVLNSALNLNIAGLAISLGTVDSLSVAVNFDLAPVRALVTGTLSDGVVSVNLGTGLVTADLEALFGAAYASSTGLNGQAPNTSVLTPAVLGAISTRAGALVTTFLNTTIADALKAAIDNTSVVVSLAAKLKVGATTAIQLDSTFSGTIGGFTGVAGHAAPVASSSISVLPGLGLLGATINAVLGLLTNGIVSAVATTVLPTIGTTVVSPLRATAVAAVTTTISGLTGTTVPGFVTSLAGVFTVLDTLVDVTINARPDAAGSVGAPAATAAGRYFETALHVGVVDGSAASIAALFFANASVGSNSLR
jgi:hypothetical protein